VTQHAAWSLTPGETKKVIATNKHCCGRLQIQEGKNCDRQIRTDIVFGVGFDVFTDARKDEYENISKEEAGRIIDECSGIGLAQMLLRCRNDVYALCNCCCVPSGLRGNTG
jgi:hypothetical protein